MCTALAPRIGYDNAAAIAKAAYASNRDVRDIAREMAETTPGFPTHEEIDTLLDPHGQTVRGTGVGGSAGG